MTIAIAILMKDPGDSKTRLAPVLANDARETLALLLFRNTLDFFRRIHAGRPLAVVTPSARISAIAQEQGVESVADHGLGGINGAAACAAEWAQRIGADGLLVIHADVPTLVDAELAELIDAGATSAVVIAESADGGTNALLVSPPGVIDFCFGRGSASAHAAAAEARGVIATRLRLPHLSRDLDTPEDLASSRFGSQARAGAFRAIAVPGLPEVEHGNDLASLIADAVEHAGCGLQSGDIVVVAQKVVSKAEGRMVAMASYEPSSEAIRIAAEIGKDARKVEAILRESSEVLRARRQEPEGLLITRHRLGWICANAGIDESNLGGGNDGMLLLLPEDPDRSAAHMRAGLEQRYGGPIGIVVTDTFGRPWRHGLANVAIGVAGIPAVDDWTSRSDAYGRGLKATLPAFADELAAAAGLLMPKNAGVPVVVIRGVAWTDNPSTTARDLLRPVSQELFL